MTSTTTTVYLSDELLEQVKLLADEMQISLDQLVAEALSALYERWQNRRQLGQFAPGFEDKLTAEETLASLRLAEAQFEILPDER
jgi:predicted transcriptional regulator